MDRRLKSHDNQTSQLIFNTNFSRTYHHPVFNHKKLKNPLFNGTVHVEWSEYLTMSTQQKAVVDKYDLNIIFKGPQGCALVEAHYKTSLKTVYIFQYNFCVTFFRFSYYSQDIHICSYAL